ncbi:MAG: proline/betaine ABC transporter permease ProW, partial [Epsilonproteobacteria bacterium]
LAAVGGLGIVFLAIVLDRLTQSMGTSDTQKPVWTKRGPVGFVLKIIRVNFVNQNEKQKGKK